MRNVLLTLVLAGACVLGGCNYLGFIFYLFIPEPTRTVAPEFDKLDGNVVAIIVIAEDEYVKNYDHFREQLIMVVSEELKRHLKKVRTVDAFQVVRYQKAHPQWRAVPQGELARQLGADYLLAVTVRDYTLRLPGSASLYCGHINADAEVFEAAKSPTESRVLWRSPEISVTYPADNRPLVRVGAGVSDLRHKLDSRFAVALVKKFRSYTIKIKEGPDYE